MAVTADDLKARFEAFADLTDAVIDPRLEDARAQVDESWGTDQDRATLLLAAHYLVIEGAVGAAPQLRTVSTEKLGDAQVGYFSPRDASPFEQTIYGARYLVLLKDNFSGAYLT